MLSAHASWDTFRRRHRRLDGGGRPLFHPVTLRKRELRFKAERPLRKSAPRTNSQLILKTPAPPTGIHVVDERQIPQPPSYPCEDGAGPPQPVRSRPSLGT